MTTVIKLSKVACYLHAPAMIYRGLKAIILVLGSSPVVRGSTTMWFNTSNIIPVGNGRLGAMVLGGVPEEIIMLNEDRIWSGSLNDPNPSNCSRNLPTIQDYIWKDALYDAQALADEECMATPLKQQVYQTAGNLTLAMHHADTLVAYNHTLDLETAVATTTYVTDGTEYTRTIFASHPDNVIVIRVTANVSSAVSYIASFATPMDNPFITTSHNMLSVRAGGTPKYDLPGSIIYNATAHISVSGELASVGPSPSNGSTLLVSDADESIILIAIDTNYIRYDDISADPAQRVFDTLSAVRDKPYDKLLADHITDHSALFGRTHISLGTPSAATYLPTDERRLLPSGADADQDLFALYAQFGRYLAIASSRKTEPSNLQGLWNSAVDPNWGSKYTLNINQQMNSWLAEPLAIPEVLVPLWDMIEDLAERGRQNAQEIYNISRGWVAHHNTGIWRDSAPIDAAFYGFWPMSGAWLMQHMYERYAYGLDVDWVRQTAYPLMKSLSEFYLDFLVEGEGYLVTNPSMSPEHGIGNYNDTNVSLTYGSTIDNSLLRDLFNHTALFANLLGVDSDFASELLVAHGRLMPFRIGSLGQIQEWAIDYDSNGPFTHISHMYPLFPGAQIDPRFNETLARAANTSLVLRGDSSNGWPTAWRVNCYARLLDGDKAYYYLQRLLKSFSLPNLWSYNSIFQIDGNFGGANGVAEMILQSHNGEIHLLPAIPSAWKEGAVRGFRARGGFSLDISWSGGILKEATIGSIEGTFARVRYSDKAINLVFVKGQSVVLGPSSF